MLIGLTGGIASGKSTVSKMIAQLGFPVVDADLIAREVVEQGQPAYQRIIQTFGEQIVDEKGDLNRKLLGELIFNDENKRKQLNNIVHPEVRKTMMVKANNYIQEGVSHVFLDIPLLFESRLTYLVDKVLLIYVDFDVQLQRLIARNNLTEKEALARIKSQIPLEEKKELADFVINNNGSLKETQNQLLNTLSQLQIINNN